MDHARFDRLARTLSSRRTALGGLLGGSLAALLGLPQPEEAGAHTFLARCRRIQSGPRRRACLRRARVHNRTCHPQPATTTCAGRCGTWANNCGQAVGCPNCVAPKTCLSNGSCGQVCQDACPTDCECRYTSITGGRYCTNSLTAFFCTQIPQACSGTTDCPVGAACMITNCGPGITRADRCVPLCPL